MKTGIFYMSKRSCVEKAAFLLKKYFKEEEVDVVNLKNNKYNNLENYDRIIIGGSVYAYKIQKEVKTFYKKNLYTLLNKDIGLFISCTAKNSGAKKSLSKCFPKKLRENAVSNGLFGGEYNFKKMTFGEKFIIKIISLIHKEFAEKFK